MNLSEDRRKLALDVCELAVRYLQNGGDPIAFTVDMPKLDSWMKGIEPALSHVLTGDLLRPTLSYDDWACKIVTPKLLKKV
jgi:hypothetical protein